MRKYCVLLLLLLPLALLTGQDAVWTVETVPDPKKTGGGYVSDPGNILSSTDFQQLNDAIRELEAQTTAQMAVVILPSIGDDIPKDFAVALFDKWGIGQEGVDNGLLILTVMDQRRTEIETGYGIESVLPDVIAYRILLSDLVPHFQQGEYGAGLIATVHQIKKVLQDPSIAQQIRAEEKSGKKIIYNVISWYLGAAAIFLLLIMVWVLLTLYNKEDLYDKYRHVRYVTSIAFIFLFPVPYLIVYFILKRLLKRLRNQPRYSALNGQLMHKLDEQADDAHLERGQIMEEELGSVDYDVWVTDDGSDALILPYARRSSNYKPCPECGFRTYHRANVRVLRAATYSHSGQREIIHECKNCRYRKRDLETIPQKTRSSSSAGSFGGGGGGGGSWGGGSSGGGGAGASW